MQIKNYYVYGTQIKLSIKGIMGCLCGVHVSYLLWDKLLTILKTFSKEPWTIA